MVSFGDLLSMPLLRFSSKCLILDENIKLSNDFFLHLTILADFSQPCILFINRVSAQNSLLILSDYLVMYLGHNPNGCVIAFFVCFCFSLDKLRCLEEGEDPEVIPENTDLVTLGYGGLNFYYKPLI